MKNPLHGLIAILLVVVVPMTILAQDTQPPASVTTPDTVESKIGTLEFKDGAPSAATAEKGFDQLDYIYAYRAFTDTFKGVSLQAILEGFHEAGIKDNEILIFSKLMDSESLFLTANADTVYYLGFVNLSDPWSWRPRPTRSALSMICGFVG